MIHSFASIPNILVATLVAVFLTFLYFSAILFRTPDILSFVERPATAVACLLWGIWWLTLIPAYLLLQYQELAWHGCVLSLLDLGSLTCIGTALIYCRGEHFRLTRLLMMLPLFVLFAAWDLGGCGFLRTPPLRVLLIAPSVVLANVSFLFLGWAFLVRWGWPGIPFLLVAVIYAMGQIPAYFQVFVVEPFHRELHPVFGSLDYVFLCLAVGKVLYAVGFLTFFCSPAPFRPDLTKARYWPEDPIYPHPRIRQFLRWVVVALPMWAIPILASAFSPVLQEWIKKLQP